MFRLTDRIDGKHVRRVRLHGVADAPWVRQRLQTALAECTLDGLGLTPRALLILDRVAPAVPLVPAGGAEGFVRSVREELAGQARRAVRPWLDPGATAAPAVLFADEAELAACLIRDWLRGGLHEVWWARLVLAGLSPPRWWRRELLPRGDLLPPVMAQLAAQGQALAWVARLDDGELTGATRAIAVAHGCAAPAVGPTVWPAEPPEADPQSRAAAARQLAVLVPEVAAVAGSPPRARLLALALGLQRDPTWVRGAGPTLALRALEPAVPDEPADWSGSDAVGSITAPVRSITGMTVPDRPADRPGSGAVVSAAAPVRSITGLPVPAIDRSSPPPDPAPMRTAATNAAPADGSGPVVRLVTPPPVGSDTMPGRMGVSPTDGAHTLAGIDEASPPVESREEGHHVPATAARAQRTLGGDILEAAFTTAGPGPILRPPSDAATWSEPVAQRIETAYGGLFYLLNLALALDLYGDFTQPLRPGLALSPWDWLALIGRGWFGRGLERDPLWGLLASLAGRPPGRAAGRGFAPPRDWSMPADWLRPWGATDELRIEVQAGRLRLWHPAGFLLADRQRLTGLGALDQARQLSGDWPVLGAPRLVCLARGSGRGQVLTGAAHRPALARWLGWLRPFLEARLALALGRDDPNSVVALVCRHRALVHCCATAVDVDLSLDELPIALRIAGLDRDPGWIPAAGRSVAFHFH